jgi:RHS repeat-associated protein
MVTPTGSSYTYHYNGIGSTVAMTDSSKAIVNKYFYTAFGVITNQQETVLQPFKYVGQAGVMQEPNGFYYMRARYYDPAIGRFISEDPIGFEGGDVNLYAYASNNPVNFFDSNGKWVVNAVGAVLGAGVSAFMEAMNPKATPLSIITATGIGALTGGLSPGWSVGKLILWGGVTAAGRNALTTAARGETPTFSSASTAFALGMVGGAAGQSVGLLSGSNVLGKMMSANMSIWLGAAFSDYKYQVIQDVQAQPLDNYYYHTSK